MMTCHKIYSLVNTFADAKNYLNRVISEVTPFSPSCYFVAINQLIKSPIVFIQFVTDRNSILQHNFWWLHPAELWGVYLTG